MSTGIKRPNLIETIYSHMSEDQWLNGVDLYQAGKVLSAKDYQGLITGSVESFGRTPSEVRIKIHPAGHTIQWIECTCRENRIHSQYCEHIAALLIYIDHELPHLVGNLDAKMPLKPVAGKRRSKQKDADANKGKDATQAQSRLLEHLSGNIENISLKASGPNLRIRFDSGGGQLTHYDLDLDQSAAFLKEQSDLSNAQEAVKELKVFSSPVQFGSYIYPVEGEDIIAERVVMIPTSISLSKASSTKLASKQVDASVVRFCSQRGKSKESQNRFYPVKSVSKYIGKNFFFLPHIGFFPLQKEYLTPEWWEYVAKKSFKKDDAADLIKTGFKSWIDLGPIWVDKELDRSNLIYQPKMSSVGVEEERDGWFLLDPTYGEGDQTVSMAELFKAASQQKRRYFKKGDTWIEIPDFVTELNWDLDEKEEFIKVDTAGLMRIQAAIGDFDSFVGSKTMLNKLRGKTEFNASGDFPPLDNTSLNLRQYQSEGYEWLWWLYSNTLHGLLADEMGLGKTHQAMAIMAAVFHQNKDAKVLVVCPTTVLEHWQDKIIEFCPEFNVHLHHGPKRLQKYDQSIKNANIILTSYGVVLRDVRMLGKVDWATLILDEAHFIKNNQSNTYKSICKIRAKFRLCLTGTPLENNLQELKTLFDFLIPGYLGSDKYFRKQFILPLESNKDDKDDKTEENLQRLIHPFKLRRTKKEVLTDLPEKVLDVRHVSLSAEQVKLYKDVLSARAQPLLDQLADGESAVPFLHVFATLTLLKQICDHPCLIKKTLDYKKHQSGKFELLKELLEEAIGSGHKIVIYSQYVQMIEIICLYLTDIGLGHVKLTGQSKNRGALIKKFQNEPDCHVFVGSLLAGGIGIDLTSASVVIHYDRWWNASKEDQATDRVHRIGQNKNVLVLKMITRGTLEERIDQLISKKASLFDRFVNRDEELFKKFTREELIALLT